MASLDEDWKLPAALQPKPHDYAYDLDRALSSVVGLTTQVPADAFTAEILGTERAGNGVLIRDDGLVLTIGYLITEAEEVWLRTNAGRSSPWMRGAPQSGLARLIWRISRRLSGVMLGLPARRRDFQRQKQRKPARCQRRTVSG